MCTSFWVGLFISLISMKCNISIFSYSLIIMTSCGSLNVGLSLFLLACMLSGTTWMIHSLVDLLDELKNKRI
jgi:hypothetical protein